jgi:DMSO/TMAO reductase YedYZ molybdopterin-dependent catalytic subunit
MAFNFFNKKPKLDPEIASRIPPGQYLTEKWPVLHYGGVANVPREKWSLRLFGLIDQEPVSLSWEDLLSLPQSKITEDIHCVTRWSRLGMDFEGVLFNDLLKLLRLRPEATHAMIHAEAGFTANLSLEDLTKSNVMFAHRADGKDLERDHGGPVRLVVPHLYFWKSAKWVRGVEFMNQDRPGFWESFGYHLRGDPWQEQRYDGD